MPEWVAPLHRRRRCYRFLGFEPRLHIRRPEDPRPYQQTAGRQNERVYQESNPTATAREKVPDPALHGEAGS